MFISRCFSCKSTGDHCTFNSRNRRPEPSNLGCSGSCSNKVRGQQTSLNGPWHWSDPQNTLAAQSKPWECESCKPTDSEAHDSRWQSACCFKVLIISFDEWNGSTVPSIRQCPGMHFISSCQATQCYLMLATAQTPFRDLSPAMAPSPTSSCNSTLMGVTGDPDERRISPDYTYHVRELGFQRQKNAQTWEADSAWIMGLKQFLSCKSLIKLLYDRAFQNSKSLAGSGLHLQILEILKESQKASKTAACCQALKKLCVNDELCKQAVTEGGLEATIKVCYKRCKKK